MEGEEDDVDIVVAIVVMVAVFACAVDVKLGNAALWDAGGGAVFVPMAVVALDRLGAAAEGGSDGGDDDRIALVEVVVVVAAAGSAARRGAGARWFTWPPRSDRTMVATFTGTPLSRSFARTPS